MSTLADRIREAAAEVGGLNRLAEEAGISRRTLGNWLTGTSPKPDGLSRIARVTGVRLEWLLNDEGPKFDFSLEEALASLDFDERPDPEELEEAEISFARAVEAMEFVADVAPPPVNPDRLHGDEWLFGELGKIVVKEHKAARQALPPEKVAVEAVLLYHELSGMVRDVTDRRTVEVVLPLLAENLRERLREAEAEPGTGKREAS